MGTEKILCWDLDETLGYFREIQSRSDLPYFLTKPGVGLWLRELRGRGYLHAVTTAADISYARRALEATRWSDLFEAVFDVATVRQTSDGKCYASILRRFGLAPEEAAERMLVIGDRAEDKPADIPDVVFVEHPEGYRYDCVPLRTILDRLSEGDGGFFERFRGMAEESSRWVSDDEAVRFRLEFRPLTLGAPDRTVPVVHKIEAETHYDGSLGRDF